MTVTLEGSGGLFTILKRVMTAMEAVNTLQATTLPADVDAILDEMSDINTVDGAELTRGLTATLNSWKKGTTLQQALQNYARDLIIDRVSADAEHATSITDCISELICQMLDASIPETVEKNVVSATVSDTPGSAAPTLVVSVTDGDGTDLESVLPETIVATFSTSTSLSFESGAKLSRLSPEWPGGSGLRTTIGVQAEGILTNYSFDDDDDRPDTPDMWTVDVGTIDTTVFLTDTEIQTITISGTPTSGYWTISHTRSDGYEQTTVPLSYDASAADVESALEALVGFTEVSVTKSGTLETSVVYTIEFNAVKPSGDQALLTTANNFDTGSILVAESTPAEPGYTFRALALIGNGSELTVVRQAVHDILTTNTVYALSVQMAKISGTAGTLVVELVNGAGDVVNDDEGTANQLTIDLSTLTTSFEPQTVFFRTPKAIPEVCYLQFRVAVAIASTKGVYLDDCILTQAQQLYTGGPYVGLFANDRDCQKEDRYEITVANDFAGRIQTWFWRWFERLLPSAASGAETISDT